eukprot:TRINITY_DN27_c0_g1_i2.p1 TRINITY_DN27_c0_g1~~TRINITY_DN27_c0_g1_i2.p1  ORF type:complete len:601 (+),score=153.86 TRINITY_DN27_c0_g1_i2:527-2329(+)
MQRVQKLLDRARTLAGTPGITPEVREAVTTLLETALDLLESTANLPTTTKTSHTATPAQTTHRAPTVPKTYADAAGKREEVRGDPTQGGQKATKDGFIKAYGKKDGARMWNAADKAPQQKQPQQTPAKVQQNHQPTGGHNTNMPHVKSGGAWKEVRVKAQAMPAEQSDTTIKLREGDWNVPILDALDDSLTEGVVFVKTRAQAKAAAGELKGIEALHGKGHKCAIVSRRKVELEMPVYEVSLFGGKAPVRAFVYGRGVQYAPPEGSSAADTHDSVKVVEEEDPLDHVVIASVTKRHSPAQLLAGCQNGSLHATVCSAVKKADPLFTRNLVLPNATVTKAKCDVPVRIRAEQLEEVLKSGGKFGFFFRLPKFEGGKDEFPIVWLDPKVTTSEALGIAQVNQGTLGLVSGSTRLGIRARGLQEAASLRSALGDLAPAPKEKQVRILIYGAGIREHPVNVLKHVSGAENVASFVRNGMLHVVARVKELPTYTVIARGSLPTLYVREEKDRGVASRVRLSGKALKKTKLVEVEAVAPTSGTSKKRHMSASPEPNPEAAHVHKATGAPQKGLAFTCAVCGEARTQNSYSKRCSCGVPICGSCLAL